MNDDMDIDVDMEMAFETYLGDVLREAVRTWETVGPPSVRSYTGHILAAFGVGYGAGYRHAINDKQAHRP